MASRRRGAGAWWIIGASAGALLVAVGPQSIAAAPAEPTVGVAAASAPAARMRVPVGRSFSVAFTGDTLVHSPLWIQAAANAGGVGFDFSPMLAPLRPLLGSVDLAVCHLESPFAPPGEPYSSAPRYGVPSEVASALASAGYDRCSTASNHSLDRGAAGVDATIGALSSAGVSQSGMARSPQEREPRVSIVHDVRVAHLSYAFGFGAGAVVGEPWRAALIDPGTIVADAVEARRRGAEAVIVSLHWGDEGISAVSAYQRRVADAVTASGQIDLVVGHHAHVLQPIERVNGVWVVFGLGNLLSNMPTGTFPASTQDGAVVTTTVTVASDGTVAVDRPTVHPTWVDRDQGFLVRPVQETLANPATTEGLRTALEQSLARTRSVLGDFVAA